MPAQLRKLFAVATLGLCSVSSAAQDNSLPFPKEKFGTREAREEAFTHAQYSNDIVCDVDTAANLVSWQERQTLLNGPEMRRKGYPVRTIPQYCTPHFGDYCPGYAWVGYYCYEGWQDVNSYLEDHSPKWIFNFADSTVDMFSRKILMRDATGALAEQIEFTATVLNQEKTEGRKPEAP